MNTDKEKALQYGEPAPALIWAKGRASGYYFKIQEGTGDNLLQEDINEGYVDYIYYDYYSSLSDIDEGDPHDGGMYMLTKLYQDMTLGEILKCIEEFEDEDLEVLETYPFRS